MLFRSPGAVHIDEKKDFTPVIEKALELGGYKEDQILTCLTFIGIFLEVGLKPLCNGSFRQLPMLPF